MKNWANMTPPKEIDRAPTTDPKEMEIYGFAWQQIQNNHLKETQYNIREHR